MGTRTYSRRSADGTRVLTALGRARAGNIAQELDIFGNEIPDSPQPVPTATVSPKATLSDADMQRVIDLMAPVQNVDRRRKPVVFSPADIQSVIDDMGVDVVTKALRSIDQANKDYENADAHIKSIQKNKQPDSEKSFAGRNLNIGGWFQNNARALIRDLINKPDDPQTKRDYDYLKNVLTSGSVNFSSNIFGGNSGVVDYRFTPQNAAKFDLFIETQVKLRQQLDKAIARNAGTRNMSSLVSGTPSAGAIRFTTFNNRLSKQLNEATEKALQRRFDRNMIYMFNTYVGREVKG